MSVCVCVWIAEVEVCVCVFNLDPEIGQRTCSALTLSCHLLLSLLLSLFLSLSLSLTHIHTPLRRSTSQMVILAREREWESVCVCVHQYTLFSSPSPLFLELFFPFSSYMFRSDWTYHKVTLWGAGFFSAWQILIVLSFSFSLITHTQTHTQTTHSIKIKKLFSLQTSFLRLTECSSIAV